jgi:hypothetical protein
MTGRTSFSLRVAAIPLLIATIVILETRQPFGMFRLATFCAIFLLLADTVLLLRGNWRDFALVLASLAFGLFLIEAAGNIWGSTNPIVLSPDGLYAPRPVIGWGPSRAGRFPNERIDPETGAAIYRAAYTIDSNLLRQTQSCEKGPAVVFFGCSFTFGLGLNDADTLPQLFADSIDRKVRILNLGFAGYGPHQFLSELQAGIFDSVIGPQPKLFVFVTAAWHAERSSCRSRYGLNGPRYTIENGQLILKGVCHEGLGLRFMQWLAGSAGYRWLIEPYWRRVNHDDIELYIQITLAAVKLAETKYHVPVIILDPGDAPAELDDYLAGTGFTTEAIIQRLRDGGAIVIDASLDKERAAGMILSIPGDGHPTALANRLLASILKNYLERNMPEVLASRFN